jgi:hypothetical protein
MDKPDTLQAIENLLDSSLIPMKEYRVKLTKLNGEHVLDIYPADVTDLVHMYLFSEILNSYTQEWYVTHMRSDGKLHIIVQ